MRDPSSSPDRIPNACMTGEKIRIALLRIISSHESVRGAVIETLEGRPSPGFPKSVVEAARREVSEVLHPGLQPDIFEAYCSESGDPDTPLAEWLRSGAPMGASRCVTRVGVFPPDIKPQKSPETHMRTHTPSRAGTTIGRPNRPPNSSSPS